MVSNLAEQRDKQTEGTVVQSEYSCTYRCRTGAEAADQNLKDLEGTVVKEKNTSKCKVD
jgi:hypothetical protein